MLALKTYEQSAIFDPTNPRQVIREVYTANPGNWGSFYFNPADSGAQLRGLNDFTFTTLPSWAQIGIVGGLGTIIGYFGMKKWGDKIKPTLRKIPVVGGAFKGLGRPRRRRR